MMSLWLESAFYHLVNIAMVGWVRGARLLMFLD